MAINRNTIISKARKKYIPETTMNITEALRLYLANDAIDEEQIPLFVSTPENFKIGEILKEYRPTCDECGGNLYLQKNVLDINNKLWPVAWICKNCSLVEYSNKSVAEWLEILNENRKQDILES